MNLKLIWTDDFYEELDFICNFLNYISKSDVLSERLISNILERVQTLSSSPEICAKIDGKYRNGFEYRKMIITHYIIIYTIDYSENIIYIMHIYDGRSNYTRNLI